MVTLDLSFLFFGLRLCSQTRALLGFCIDPLSVSIMSLKKQALKIPHADATKVSQVVTY